MYFARVTFCKDNTIRFALTVIRRKFHRVLCNVQNLNQRVILHWFLLLEIVVRGDESLMNERENPDGKA